MERFVSLVGEPTPIHKELNQKAAEYAQTKGFEYLWSPQKPYNKQQVIQLLSESDVGLVDVEPYDATVFNHITPRCKMIVRFGVGFDNMNLPEATASGIAVTRTTGANSTGVAEMALTHILAAKHQLMINRKVMNSGIWVKNVGSELIGATVGIVGFGAIGQTLAKLLSGFHCRILAYDLFLDEEKMKALGVEKSSFDTLVEESDAISIHVPYSSETHHMFNAETFQRMKPSAVIVSTARGNIIDEDALYEALRTQTIAAAGLDVFAEEPCPKESKLIGLDNIILTPHVASQTVESLWAMYQKAIDIAADFFAGKELSRLDFLNPEVRTQRTNASSD